MYIGNGLDANGAVSEGTATTTTTPTGTTGAPCVGCSGHTRYLRAPWQVITTKLPAEQKDSQLQRWTMILQALAALATIIVITYTLARGKRD